MKMTDEMFIALNFKKEGDYWFSQDFKGDIMFSYHINSNIKLEEIIRKLKARWVEEAEDKLRSSFRSLLGIYKSKNELY